MVYGASLQLNDTHHVAKTSVNLYYTTLAAALGKMTTCKTDCVLMQQLQILLTADPEARPIMT